MELFFSKVADCSSPAALLKNDSTANTFLYMLRNFEEKLFRTTPLYSYFCRLIYRISVWSYCPRKSTTEFTTTITIHLVSTLTIVIVKLKKILAIIFSVLRAFLLILIFHLVYVYKPILTQCSILCQKTWRLQRVVRQWKEFEAMKRLGNEKKLNLTK